MKINKIMADIQFLDNKVIEFTIENKLLNTKKKVINVNYDMDYEIVNCVEAEDGYFGIVDFTVNLTGKIDENEAFKIHLKKRGSFIGSKEKL